MAVSTGDARSAFLSADSATAHRASAVTLDAPAWRARQCAHDKRVAVWLDPHAARASRGEKHPVYDFLFDYYSFRPGQLRRWQPGFGVVLTGLEAREFLRLRGYVETPGGVTLDPALFTARRRESVAWVAALLRVCVKRPPQFACFGLHEWAMVYRSKALRHPHPLRFPSAAIDKLVDALPVRCSHFDAFRFFTPEARPLNRLQPTRETRLELEQPGCLHVNMDLYKWAYKLSPWTPSDLLADTFELARDIREIDMRASPYDLSALGFAPIAIETPEGRADYERHQRIFAERARPIRGRLLALCERLLDEAPWEKQP